MKTEITKVVLDDEDLPEGMQAGIYVTFKKAYVNLTDNFGIDVSERTIQRISEQEEEFDMVTIGKTVLVNWSQVRARYVK